MSVRERAAASAPVAVARARFARRRWSGRLRRWRTAVVVLLGLVLACTLAWVLWWSDLLAVDGVGVDGEQVLSEEEVRVAAGVGTGTPLARVDLDAVAGRVEALAPVADAEVRREWPGTLRIEVREREPVAVLAEAGEYRALDAEGVLFRSYPDLPAGLPLVQGDELAEATETGSAGSAREDALREVASVVVALEPAVARQVDHVEVASLDAVVLVLADGAVVRWGSAEDSAFKAEVLTALMRVPAATYDVSAPSLPTTSGTAPAS